MSTHHEAQLTQLVLSHLPNTATVINIEGPLPRQAIYIGDLTGDEIPEISVVYKANEELYLMVLIFTDQEWKVAARIKGHGYGLTLMISEPILYHDRKSLLIGWQIGAVHSKLSIYQWEDGEFIDAAPEDLYYSSIEIINTPGISGGNQTSDMALWIHDTGEAYRVEVLRFREGKFVPAWDVYPYYLVNVVRYYERKTEEHPNYPLYWYYLADAQYRAGMLPAALQSIQKNLLFQNPYPSRKEIQQLQSKIENIYKHMGGQITDEQIIEEQKMGKQKMEKQMTEEEIVEEQEQFIEQTATPAVTKRGTSLLLMAEKTTEGTKWGYINAEGETVIPLQYSEARDFQKNGLAVAAQERKYGLIKRSGEYLVEPVYTSIAPFVEKRAIVTVDEYDFAMLNEEGKMVTEQTYPFISNLTENRSVYSMETTNSNTGSSVIQYGYLDSEGEVVIPAQYEEASDYDQQKAVVKIKDYEYALINEMGERLATYPYYYVGNYSDGFLVFKETASGTYGYMDVRGTAMIPPSFTGATAFHQGQAIVNTSDVYKPGYGVIDKQGVYIIPAEYQDIRVLGEDRWAVGRNLDAKHPLSLPLYAIADRTGTLLTEFLFSDVSGFIDGLASVNDQEQTYFIDVSGTPVPGYPRIEGSGTLTVKEDDVIQAFIDQRLFYVNRTGNVIWEPNKVISLNGTYRVKEEKYKPNPNYLVYYPVIEGMPDAISEQRVNIRMKQLAEVKKVPLNEEKEETFTGDYEVIYYKKDLVVIELNGYHYTIGAAHGLPTKIHALIHLVTGRIFMLRDLFKAGADYVKVLSKRIRKIITDDPAYSYVFSESYQGIKPNQPFYVSDNALHLYFAPYEIGPYAAGFPAFTIPFDEIKELIYKEGEFWKSFQI
ncbi:WG repeat-containing protein [Paenibacillus polygoni]|uniref:WG repeat-containing protein n=1 Tax=Paenibacillus polygoni TaxID=3050112 RepID=A0ABY8WX47_9BACL|nr:WG repeat-containing protein [Paenibacillus polygoni]WIV17610.1 WG repeat-containing protein [Paenibacillus polygoni]